MTTFTYEEVTTSTENVINEHIAKAQKASTRALREMHLDFATGALFNWSSLTAGRQNPGEYDRLLNLIEEAAECP